MDNQPPLSRNETIKAESRFLRGTIAEGLTHAETGSLSEDDGQLTKFHGFYQQDDRDLRPERGRQKMEKAFSFMVRLRIPGGGLSPAQWLAAERVALERGSGTIRLTTRQTIQFHGILKGNLRPAFRALYAQLLDSIAACGDVNRNVIASTVPWRKRAHDQIATLATDLSVHLLPKTHAWHEIWIEGAQVEGGEVEEEPILGRTYLPRKFKIAIALPPHNDVDVFAHDLGFIAIEQAGKIVGYNVTLGGGMGMTHGEPGTFPRTGDVVGFCRADQAIAVAEAVVTVQRDHGDRSDRKHARLKYTIERIGLDAFVAAVEARLGFKLAKARKFAFTGNGDQLGWIEGDDGTHHYGLFIENGRIHDLPGRRLLSGLHAFAALGIGRLFLTANQSAILAEIPAAQRQVVADLLAEYGLDSQTGALRRSAMACVALPTCGLALAESERYLPDLLTRLEQELAQAGLADDEITIRMTGCPNGCARPYLAEIGLVGRNPGVYNLYLGAAFDGSRLNKLYRKDISGDAIVAALAPLFVAYAAERRRGEHFGDFVIRAGHVRATTAGRDFHNDILPEAGA